MDENGEENVGSILGTKEYWETAYENDLDNYETTDDSGEIWFGRACQDRMIKWLRNRSDISPETCQILDLGCGNGAMTLALRQIGYEKVTGVDYAEAAIKLAKCVAVKEGFSEELFEVFDILSDSFDASLHFENHFDVLLDKGTYDAVGLMTNGAESRLLYKRNVIRFLDSNSPNRLLVIASCNSTKDELLDFFRPEFDCIDEIVASNKMTFGGRTGSTVTTIVLQLSDKR